MSNLRPLPVAILFCYGQSVFKVMYSCILSLLFSYIYAAASPVAKERLPALICERIHRQQFLGLWKIILGSSLWKESLENCCRGLQRRVPCWKWESNCTRTGKKLFWRNQRLLSESVTKTIIGCDDRSTDLDTKRGVPEYESSSVWIRKTN